MNSLTCHCFRSSTIELWPLVKLELNHQNMVCGSNTEQRDHFPRIQLVVSLFSGIHQICIPTFPFDPLTQSDTFEFKPVYVIVVTRGRVHHALPDMLTYTPI